MKKIHLPLLLPALTVLAGTVAAESKAPAAMPARPRAVVEAAEVVNAQNVETRHYTGQVVSCAVVSSAVVSSAVVSSEVSVGSSVLGSAGVHAVKTAPNIETHKRSERVFLITLSSIFLPSLSDYISKV